MNQDTVKSYLLELHDCKEEFTVIFSGKKSKKVNGFYKLDSREIIIHNRNFYADEAGNNMLFYTAMHELAHHIQFTENKQKSVRAHTQLFQAILNDLADIAEKKGLYAVKIVTGIQEKLNEISTIDREIAELQRKKGKAIIDLHDECKKEGVRFEDVVERKAQISKKTMNRSIHAYKLNLPEDIGADIQEAVIQERDEEKREAIISAGQSGKSVAQAKRAATPYVPQEDETVSLVKEKNRLDRTINALSRRRDEVAEQLKSRGEL